MKYTPPFSHSTDTMTPSVPKLPHFPRRQAAMAGAEPPGVCANPFCGLPLRSRVAQFCEDRANCQRYRAVVLHCAFRRVLQSAGAPLPSAGASDGVAQQEDAFSIPKRKRKQPEEVVAPAKAKKGKKKKKKREAEAALQAADVLPTEARVRLRHVQRLVGADAAPSTSPPPEKEVPVVTTAVVPGPTGRGTTARIVTTAPRSRQMGIDIVPLGAGNQAVNLAGGGRYVQSGNRAAKPTLPSPAVVVRPPPPPLPPKPTTIYTGAAVAGGDARSFSRIPPALPTAVSPHSAGRVVGGQTVNPAAPRLGNGFGRPVDPRLVYRNPNLSVGFTQETPKSTRISPLDYLSTRNREPTALDAVRPSFSTPGAPKSAESFRPTSNSYSYSRDVDDQDFSFSGWEQPNEQAQQPAADPRRPYNERPTYHGDGRDHRSFSRSASYSDDRQPPTGRPDYRRSNSDSMPSTYPRPTGYPERSPSEMYKYEDGYGSRDQYRYDRTTDSAATHSSRPSEQERIDPYRYDQSSASPLAHNSRASDFSDGGLNQRQPDMKTKEPAARRRDVPSIPEEYAEPQFSGRDRDIRSLLSVFICEIPNSIGAVKNTTKKPRKMKWYLDYVSRTVKLFKDYVRDVKIDIKDKKAVMTVNSCQWLVLEDPSTQELYNRVLLRLLAEGLMWRHIKVEAEKRERDAVKYGNERTRGVCFIEMWNWFKQPRSQEYVSLEKHVRYFCGDTKHHWSFVIGNVEIGSGSHEDKRVAFNMAAEQSMELLLSLRMPEADRMRWARSDPDDRFSHVDGNRYHGSRDSVASSPRTREIRTGFDAHRNRSREISERDSFGRDPRPRESRGGSDTSRDRSRERAERHPVADPPRVQGSDSNRRSRESTERTSTSSVSRTQDSRGASNSRRNRSQERSKGNPVSISSRAHESSRNPEPQRDRSPSLERSDGSHRAAVDGPPQSQPSRNDSDGRREQSRETSERTIAADPSELQEPQDVSDTHKNRSQANSEESQDSSADRGTPTKHTVADEQTHPEAEVQPPSQLGSRSNELVDISSDATATPGSEVVAGLPPGFVLRRPSADLRPRNPPQADPLTRGPTSILSISGLPANFRGSGKDQVGGGDLVELNAQKPTPGLSDDDMSISEESDEDSTEKPAPQAPPVVATASSASSTTCHFCSVIRLRKPNVANAKCFRCQSKANNS